MFEILLRRFFKRENKSSEDRAIIVHNHLFKNAGSTIDWALKRNFKKGFVDHRDDDSMNRGAEYLGPYLSKRIRIKALSTHHLALPLPELDRSSLLMIMMFRHPIERVSSVYNFERKQVDAQTPGAIHARKYDIKEYVAWRMRIDVPPTIRDFQTWRCLARRDLRISLTADDFRKATAFLPDIEMLGVVERFDESMVLFEEFLRPYFPQIDLSYRIQNVGQQQWVSREKRLKKLRTEIGEDLFESLLENNRYDIKLYDMVCQEFERRQGFVKDFPAKLENFLLRCQQLATD